jgi:septal ring-binding cell division protein DamX
VYVDTLASANTLEEILAREANVAPQGANSEARKPSAPKVTYEIIVASFKTMQQAADFVKEMKTKGVQLRAIESLQPRNRKKVSYGSYATKEEAYRDLPKVQKTIEPTAWVDRIVR